MYNLILINNCKQKLKNVKNTAVCILSDKEEIGSMGNKGMESHMFDFFISEMLNKDNKSIDNAIQRIRNKSRDILKIEK